MVIRVAICCEEDKYLGQVEHVLTEYGKNKGVLFSINSFSSTFALFETMVSDFHIYIFDTELTSPKRIKLAQSIKKKNKFAYLIFLTTAIDLNKDIELVQFVNFVTKPLDLLLLENELDRALRLIEKIDNDYMIIKNHDGYFKIYLSGVYYIETFNRNLLFHTDHGEILCSKKMHQLENELTNQPFIRCHNSYIVNMNYVRRITKNEIELENREKVLVSKWRRKSVVESLISYVENF